MTKSYSVGFIFMLNWRTKKEVKKSRYFMHKIHVIWLAVIILRLKRKKLTVKLREMARSLFYF